MTQSRFTIPNISCGHCVKTIKDELHDIPGVSAVDGDPVAKTIVVTHDVTVDQNKLRAVLREINYPAS